MSNYTTTDLEILSQNISPSNLMVNSLTFVNNTNNVIIEDAIHINENGDFILKDKYTEVELSKVTSLSNNIIEKKENITDDLDTIYFVDKNNSKISLGSVFKNLFIDKSFSGDRWFSSTRSLKLDYSLEEDIKTNYYTEKLLEVIDSNGGVTLVKDIKENDLSQSNVWHSLPIEVITDDYVSNKYGIVSANIPLKYKSILGSNTIFRIFDATVGIELSRTSIYLPPVLKETIINIPLTYQGNMPDSPISKGSTDCECVSIHDLDNLELVNGKDKGQYVTQDQDGFYLVPISKHIIKIQWQTCDIVDEYLKDTSFGRSISSNVSTSLSVDLYNTIQTNDEYYMLNGIIPTIKDELTKTIEIDNTKYDFNDDYSISLCSNKNIRLSIIEKTKEYFTIKWNKPIDNGEIYWKILKVIKGVDEDLTELSNVDRELNHNLFKDKIKNVVDRNVCNSLDSCISNFSTYEFKEILPSGGSSTPFPDEELINGLKEYNLLGYETSSSTNKTIKFYKSIDSPIYDVHFVSSSNTTYGVWSYNGTMSPGTNVSFFYSPNEGYCDTNSVTYRLPISTVRIPKIKCNLCENVNITYTLATSGSDKPVECSTEFYHVVDSFGNIGYSTEDDFLFNVGLDTTDTTCTFEISGSSVVGSNEIVTVLKKITYDEISYGDTYSLSGAPIPEIGVFDPSNTSSFSDDNVAFLTSDNKISLNVDYDSDRFSKYFSPSDDRVLKTTYEVAISGEQYNRFLVTDDSFLGQDVFGYQVVLFDPFLTVDPIEGELPLFPNYNPIGNLDTLDSIREYINSGDVHYTNENFIPFPNFKIGSVTIDGSRYNPLLDYRNYRVEGNYNTYFGETTFTPNDLDVYKLTQNSVFETIIGDRFKVVNDGSNTGLIDKGNIAGIDVKVYKSGRRFVLVTDLFFNTFVSMNNGLIQF